MTFKEKFAMDPDLVELFIKILKADLSNAETRITKLETALKKIKSRVWEYTEATPTTDAWMRHVAREALK